MITPHSAFEKRVAAFQEMPETLKAVARQLDRLAGRESRVELLVAYERASFLYKVNYTPETFGQHGIRLLSKYLGVRREDLFDLMMLPRVFTRDDIKKLAKKPLSNGRRVEVGHVIELVRAQRLDRESFTRQLYERSLTPRQLKKAVIDLEVSRQSAQRERVLAKRHQGEGARVDGDTTPGAGG